MNDGNMGGKVFSVDDLVGGFFGRNMSHAHGSTGGFPRTDSEAAFQEFLKRIPSASNLAAAANQLDAASASQLQQQLQGNAGGMLSSVSIGDMAGGGMHRVPSLDFLKSIASLSQMQQLGAQAMGGVKLEGPALSTGASPLLT